MTTGQQIAMALRIAYLALHRRSDASFAPLGVTADQFVLLATLSRSEKALKQRELARRMGSDPSTVRAMLVLLERNGVVQRDSHPADARARTIVLTRKGKRTLDRLWTAGEPIRAQMLDVLGPEESATLLELLTRVAEALTPSSAPVGASLHDSRSCPFPEVEP